MTLYSKIRLQSRQPFHEKAMALGSLAEPDGNGRRKVSKAKGGPIMQVPETLKGGPVHDGLTLEGRGRQESG